MYARGSRCDIDSHCTGLTCTKLAVTEADGAATIGCIDYPQ